MASSVSTYAFINAKLRARISTLLDNDFFRAMARSRSFVEAIAMLTQTPYAAAAEVYSRTGDVKLAELELVRSEWRALGDLDRFTPAGIRHFTRAILAELEVETVKHALRLWFERTVRGRSVDDKVAYLIRGTGSDSVPVDECINAGSPEEIERALADKPYLAAIRERLHVVAEAGSLFGVEVAIDRWFYGQLVAAARSLDSRDSGIALRLIGIQVDIRNVNWIVRTKRYYATPGIDMADSVMPGGQLISPESLREAYRSDRPMEPLVAALDSRYASIIRTDRTDDVHGVQRLAVLEELLRSILYEEIRRTLGGYPFTIGTVLAYFLLVQNEVRVLISVLNGRYYDLAPERIEELL